MSERLFSIAFVFGIFFVIIFGDLHLTFAHVKRIGEGWDGKRNVNVNDYLDLFILVLVVEGELAQLEVPKVLVFREGDDLLYLSAVEDSSL